jgi:hypothetical protein
VEKNLFGDKTFFTLSFIVTKRLIKNHSPHCLSDSIIVTALSTAVITCESRKYIIENRAVRINQPAAILSSP